MDNTEIRMNFIVDTIKKIADEGNFMDARRQLLAHVINNTGISEELQVELITYIENAEKGGM